LNAAFQANPALASFDALRQNDVQSFQQLDTLHIESKRETLTKLHNERPRRKHGHPADRFGGAKTWVLPNPSGLNRAFNLDALVSSYRELRIASSLPQPGRKS
jgi:G:T/U-mismatch repair DNA glycosylase